MRNTSESPDANEQAKTTPTRSRTGARSKSENATPVSQEQDVKKPAANPTSAHRGSSTGSTASPVRAQAKSEPETPRASGASAAHSAPAQSQRPAPTQRSSGATAPAQPQRPAPTQRNSGATAPAQPQRNSGAAPPAPRQGGSVQSQRPFRPAGPYTQQTTTPNR